MATFVQCTDGNFANLDRVDGIRQIKGNDYCYELLVLDGNKPPLVLGRINVNGLLDVKRLQGPVLPAKHQGFGFVRIRGRRRSQGLANRGRCAGLACDAR